MYQNWTEHNGPTRKYQYLINTNKYKDIDKPSYAFDHAHCFIA